MALTEQQAYNLIKDTAYRLKSQYPYFKDIDAELVARVGLGIAKTETGGKLNPDAKNKTSTAKGLFQVLDGTKKSMEKKFLKIPVASTSRMFDPGYNTLIGLAVLAYNMKRYNNDVWKSVIAYNQGHWDSKSNNNYYNVWDKWRNKSDYATLNSNYSGSEFAYLNLLYTRHPEFI